MKQAIELVVCDMAGTTVLDRGEVPGAFTSALAEFGVEVSPAIVRSIRGASKQEALAQLLGDTGERYEAVYARFKELLASAYKDSTSSVAGTEAAFKRFGDIGVKVALNTGFERSIVEFLLAGLDWSEDMFACVVCGDEVASGRPAPDLIQAAMKSAGVHAPGRVANVGDTVLDLQAGAAAGVGVNIGVLSGAHSKEQLLDAPHTHIVASIAGVPDLLRELAAP